MASQEKNHTIRTLTLTSLFCLLVAFTTYAVWPGKMYIHLFTSFGYGWSAVFFGHMIERWLPNIPSPLSEVLSLFVAIGVGSINAYYWMQESHELATLGQMKPVFLLAFLFSAMCYYYFYTSEQSMRIKKDLETAKRIQAEQEKAIVLSQLGQLQSQIEPHFLFNTLANLNVLIDEEPELAKKLLSRFTELLRANLSKQRQQTASISDEITLLTAYLDIQVIRLGPRFSFNIVCDDDVDLQQKIPPLLIQPLVENAVFHGIEPKREGGEVTIHISESEHNLYFEVLDDGVGLQLNGNHTGSDIGLDNIRYRLAALSGEDKATLSIVERCSGGVMANISLPKSMLMALESTPIKDDQHE